MPIPALELALLLVVVCLPWDPAVEADTLVLQLAIQVPSTVEASTVEVPTEVRMLSLCTPGLRHQLPRLRHRHLQWPLHHLHRTL